MNKAQQRLLRLIKENPGADTRMLVALRGDPLYSEPFLRDRLLRLVECGLLRCKEREDNRNLLYRKWWVKQEVGQ